MKKTPAKQPTVLDVDNKDVPGQFTHADTKHLPRILLKADIGKVSQYSGTSLFTVEITRADGKVARINLDLASNGSKVKATMLIQGRHKDSKITRQGKFVDWN